MVAVGRSAPANFTFSIWPDEVGTADANASPSGATWTASDANFNSQPVAYLPNGCLFDSPLYASAFAQPGETVVIARNHDDTVAKGRVFAGLSLWQIGRGTGTNSTKWRFFGGVTKDTAAIFDTGAHVFDGQWNSASSVFAVDGTTQASGSAGTNTYTRTRIGQGSGAQVLETITVVFYGVKDSLLTAGERSDLLAWSQSHYATP